MKLGALFQDVPVLEKIHWDPHRSIKKITSDSRAIEPGDIFVACPGSRMDGHDFLGQAVLAKASAVIFERMPEINLPSRVTGLRVENSQACLAEILNRFYDYPDRKVKLVGVTGTNGKTTIAYLLHQILREKARAAYVGTLWYELPHGKIQAPNTTPGAEVLIPLLKQMQHERVAHCVMEVSSHALEQRRVHGLEFELAIFTQLTRDHLDYHKDMEHYFQSKRLLFSSKPFPRQILINKDCLYGQRLLEEHPNAKSVSLKGPADYEVVSFSPSFQGSQFRLRFKGREVPFHIRLPMRHNVANVATVLAALHLMGLDPEEFRGVLSEIHGIPGRMEAVSTLEENFQVFVDYAHTPDAVENVLSEARKLNPKRVLALLGCGGDRDRGKRPLMAQMACRYSDIVIFTSDNPRSEDPEAILREIQKGVPAAGKAIQVIEILDRHEAIEKLVSLAEPGDVLFVLGKGHENYQIIGDKKNPFDDRLVVQECLKRKSGVFLS